MGYEWVNFKLKKKKLIKIEFIVLIHFKYML